MAPDTLTCNANMLESDGLKHILKKVLHPNNELEIRSYISDGDHKNQAVIDTLKWDDDDDVRNPMIGQLVVENEPIRYQGKLELNVLLTCSWKIKLEISRSWKVFSWRVFV